MAGGDEDLAAELLRCDAGQERLDLIFLLDVAGEEEDDVAVLDPDAERVGVDQVVGRRVALGPRFRVGLGEEAFGRGGDLDVESRVEVEMVAGVGFDVGAGPRP